MEKKVEHEMRKILQGLKQVQYVGHSFFVQLWYRVSQIDFKMEDENEATT